MAEKILDIRLNAKEAIKAVKQLDESIEDLEGGVSDLQRGLNDLEKELAEVTGASGKDLAKRKQLTALINKTKANLKQEKEALKQSTKQRQKANKTLTTANKKLKEQAKAHNEVSKGLTKSIGGTTILDQATGGLFSKFTGLSQGLGAASKGLGRFKLALLGTGVGAFVVVLGSLVAAFTASEEGQNKLTKGLNQAKAVLANVVELFSQLGNGITSTFSALGKFITGKGSLSEVGDAIGNTFDTVSDKVKNLSKDIKEDVDAAGELSDAIAKADKIDRDLLVERQKVNTRVNELRTKAYNTEKFNAEERIAFLEEAITIEDRITNKEIEAARLRFEAKKKENDMTTLVSKDAADEQAKLEAKLFELEAKKVNRQREVANQRQMLLRKQKADEEKAAADALKIENDRLQAIEDIQDDYAQRELEKQAETELQKVELEEANTLKELEALNASEEAKQQVIEFYYSLKDDARKEDALKAIEIIYKDKEEEKKKADDQKKLDQDVFNAKLDIAQGGLALIGEIAGKGSKVAKAAAIAQATVAGIQSTIETFKTASASPITTVFPAYPFIQAGLAAGFAAVNVAKIKSTQMSGGGSSSPNVSGGRGETTTAQAPAFNVVGASSTNQLAEAIGQQEAQPVKAFVVSNEITNAQSLERNTIEGASIG